MLKSFSLVGGKKKHVMGIYKTINSIAFHDIKAVFVV